jgi:hypothetical protein
MTSQSKQDIFAENLKGYSMGMALFDPLPIGPEIRDIGNVGDIAFFNEDGRYRWVSNAFCSDNVTTRFRPKLIVIESTRNVYSVSRASNGSN